MHRLFAFLVALVILLASEAAGSADSTSPPSYCTDSSGVRYAWSSDQCANARAEWAKAHSAPVASNPTAAAPAASGLMLIPKGTLIVVATRLSLSSYGASAGEKIRYTVVDDVVVNGYVIAKAGDSAVGQVQEAQQGKNNDFSLEYKAADLRVSVDSVYNYCGDTISVFFDRVEYRRRQGVFGSNADITIKQGQQYAAIVDHPQKICGTVTTGVSQTPGPDVIMSGTQP